jgi:hypothetical protein
MCLEGAVATNLVDVEEAGHLDEPLDIVRVDIVVAGPLSQLVPLV